ncbi:MAG: cell division protein FtsL [Chromatiales bacterium]|nr:cell division protein FtsL [Chromatiales bacterium]
MSAESKAIGICAFLSIAVITTAIACVYARHESRKQFSLLQQLIVQRDALEVDWGRLQIEQSTWSTHSRVERLARRKMGMRNPAPDEIMVVRQ